MTVRPTVPQDSNKWKIQSHEEAPRSKRVSRGGRGRGNRKQSEWGWDPPQSVPVGGQLCQFVEEWKRITNDPVKYRSQGVQTSFYESTPSAQDPMGITISPGAPDSGNAWENIPDASEKHDNRGTSGYSRILFKCFPGTQSVRRMSSNRFKTTERSLCTSLSYPHYKLSAEYCRKRRLHVQNRSAGCILSCTNTSRQQEVRYLRFAFQNKVYQFRVLPFSLNPAPQVFPHLGHTVAAYLHRQGISVIPYLDDWLIHHPDRQALLWNQFQLLKTLDFVQNILPSISVVHVYIRVPVHGVTQLGFRSHPTRSSTSEAITTTFSFFRSDKPVYTTASFRPISPCQPTQALAGHVFSHLWNPFPAFPCGVHDIYRRLYRGLGHPFGRFPDFGYLNPFRPQTPYQQFGTQSGNFGPPSLGHSVMGPSSYDHYGQHYSSVLYQQTGRNPFPHAVKSSSGSVPMATNSRHSHQGQTHSRLSERDSGPSISQ